CLLPLKIVAWFGLQEEYRAIDQLTHGCVALAGAGRLDQDEIKTVRFQNSDQDAEVSGHGAAPWRGRQATDEDPFIVRTNRHAEAVPKQGAACERTLRVASKHRYRLSLAAQQLNQLSNKRTLADAAAAGDGDDPTRFARAPDAHQNLSQ